MLQEFVETRAPVFFLSTKEVNNMDEELEGEEAEELIEEVETIIEAIKNGSIDGEYFEF